MSSLSSFVDLGRHEQLADTLVVVERFISRSLILSVSIRLYCTLNDVTRIASDCVSSSSERQHRSTLSSIVRVSRARWKSESKRMRLRMFSCFLSRIAYESSGRDARRAHLHKFTSPPPHYSRPVIQSTKKTSNYRIEQQNKSSVNFPIFSRTALFP